MATLEGALRTILDKFKYFGDYLRVAAKTFGQAVSQGDVNDTTRLHLIASDANIVAATETVWAPSVAYTWQTADQTPKVVSSDADDDGAPAGNGAQTVRVWWLNSAGVEATEDVTLNGVNNVDMTASTVRRINRAEVLTVGSSGENEGNITVYATDGATIMAYIPAGMGVNDGLIQTVPAGKRDIIAKFSVDNVVAQICLFTLLARTSSSSPWIVQCRLFASRRCTDSAPFVPFVFAAGTDYIVQGLNASATQSNVTAELNGWRESV
jgi:hypothetical protein